MGEMELFIRRVVESSHESLLKTCNSLSNAEILLMLLQSPPPVTCADSPTARPVTEFTWVSCPLSLTRIKTTPPAPAPKRALAADVQVATESEGFWSSSLEPINGMVNGLLSISLLSVKFATQPTQFSIYLTCSLGFTLFLRSVAAPSSRCICVSRLHVVFTPLLHRAEF